MLTTNSFPFTFQQISNITPYTYNSGATMLDQLYALRDYITKTVTPAFDGEMQGLLTQFQTGIANIEAVVNADSATRQTAYDTFVASTNALVNTINNRIGNPNIFRATLTGPYTLVKDPSWPDAQPVTVQLTQDGTGNHPVTPGTGITGTLNVNTAPGGMTEATLVPNGAGSWVIHQDQGPANATAIAANAAAITATNAAKLAIADAAATYLTKTDATGAYLAKTDAATTYLAKTDANTAYAKVEFAAEYAAPGDYDANANKPVKLGVVLDKGSAGAFDAGLVESLTVIQDPESGRLAGVYTGYTNTTGTAVGSIGLAYSDDGIRWDKAGQLLAPSGVVGTGDKSGATGPVLVLWQGLYHLFYIGLGSVGYEGGPRQLMLATTPSLKTPVWTRRGAVLTAGGTGWRSQDVWHPSIVRHRDKWYCFVNASGVIAGVNQERIGYATADTLTGPWTFDDTNSPVLASSAGILGDPSVHKIRGGWRMDYYSAANGQASDWYTTTSDAAFPLGWVAHDETNTAKRTIQTGPAGTMDENYAHKPFILRYGGRTLHYYTAVAAGNTSRRIALAVNGGGPIPPMGDTKSTVTPSNYGAFSQVRSGPTDLDKALNTTWAVAMNAKAIISARVGDLIEFTLGYVANGDPGDCRSDVVLLAGPGGAAVKYVSGNNHGMTRWGAIGGSYKNSGGTYYYRVAPEDLLNDTITATPVFRVDSNIRTVYGTTNDPIEFTARNLG